MANVSTISLPNGLTLSYAHQGRTEDDALVLLPGPTDSWRSYEPVLDRLPSSLHSIAISARGHGDSDKPATGYLVEDFAADVIAFLDALGVERSVLAGHSGSCLVARRIALDHPLRVAGLILEASPTTLRGDARAQEFVAAVISELDDPISPEFARSFLHDTSSDRIAPPLLDQLVDDVLKVPATVWKQTFRGLLAYDDSERLSQIVAPTLLVWGDADPLIARDTQAELLRCIPTAQLIVHAGAGHTPRWDDPSRFSADVSTFVAGVL